MKLSKNVNNKKCAPKLILFQEKNLNNFDRKNWLWKSEFCYFLQLSCKYLYVCTQSLKLFYWAVFCPLASATVCNESWAILRFQSDYILEQLKYQSKKIIDI